MSTPATMLHSYAVEAEAHGATLLGALVGVEYDVGLHAPVTREAARAVFAAHGAPDAVPLDYAAAEGIGRGTYEVPVNGYRGFKLKTSEFSRKRGDTSRSIGVYAIAAVEGESGDNWPCVARVRVDLAAGVAVALPPEGGAGLAVGLEHAAKMAAWANYLIGNVGSRDLSGPVVARIQSLGGVTLFGRKSGVYFVPASSVAAAEAFAADLLKIGVTMTVAHQTHSTIVGPARSAAGETFADKIAALRKTAHEVQAKGKRRDALGNAQNEAVEILDQISLYREILGVQADALAAEADALRAFYARAVATKDAGSDDFAFAIDGEDAAPAAPPPVTLACLPPVAVPAPVKPPPAPVDDPFAL